MGPISPQKTPFAPTGPLALDHFLVVGVHDEREHRPIRARGGLDHVRHVALSGGLLEVLELLPRELRVPREVDATEGSAPPCQVTYAVPL